MCSVVRYVAEREKSYRHFTRTFHKRQELNGTQLVEAVEGLVL